MKVKRVTITIEEFEIKKSSDLKNITKNSPSDILQEPIPELKELLKNIENLTNKPRNQYPHPFHRN